MRKAAIIGNLGRDAELKQTTGGKTVCNFTVAAKTGRTDDESIWFSCAMFGERGQKVCQYLLKGTKVYVRGDFKIRPWESNGKSGIDVDVTVDDLELLSSKKEERGGAPF